VIHHSLTEDSGTVSWDAIRRYHVETNGWNAIGYHFGVEMIGGRYEILFGRPLRQDAAAVKEAGMNKKGIHVCCVGNFDQHPPHPEMWQLTAELVSVLCAMLKIPNRRIFGHRDFAKKTCPGRQFNLDTFRRDVENIKAN
jgi:hypothetical protein